jgi:3-keto-5-aminohexanoate cleavage enzyme
MSKTIITCALNGVLTDPKQHNVPVTPEEMAKEAKAAYDAGAAMMHVHLRQQEPARATCRRGTCRVEGDQQAIREACPGVIINHTTGRRRPELSGRAGLRARNKTRNRRLQRRLAELSQGEGRRNLGLAADVFDNTVEKVQTLSRRDEDAGRCRNSNASTSASCAASACIKQTGMYSRARSNIISSWASRPACRPIPSCCRSCSS